MKHLLSLTTLTLTAILFTACAAIEKAEHNSTEQLLSASGFKAVPANTAQRQQSLANLKPYTIQRIIKGNAVYYVYPDTKGNIAFIGDQAAYAKYQNLLVQQQISDNNVMAAQMMEMPGVWNDWGYWGY